MSNSSDDQPGHCGLSDERMDSLLRDFFALETPSALNRGFQPRVAAVRSGVSILKEDGPVGAKPPFRRGRNLIAATVMSVLGLGLLVLLQSPDRGPAANVSGNVRTTTPAPAHEGPRLSEDLMLVSPQGDAPLSTRAVSDDGVTLEETDTIELRPREQD